MKRVCKRKIQIDAMTVCFEVIDRYHYDQITVSFPDFSRRFSVSLAISIDTFGEVLLKGFTQS